MPKSHGIILSKKVNPSKWIALQNPKMPDQFLQPANQQSLSSAFKLPVQKEQPFNIQTQKNNYQNVNLQTPAAQSFSNPLNFSTVRFIPSEKANTRANEQNIATIPETVPVQKQSVDLVHLDVNNAPEAPVKKTLDTTLQDATPEVKSVQEIIPVQQRSASMQPPTENFNALVLQQKINEADSIIKRWTTDYADTTSNMYAQQDLSNQLATMLDITDRTGNIERVSVDDITCVRKIMEKYTRNKDVSATLKQMLGLLQKQEAQQTPMAKHANEIIQRYYTPAMRTTILQWMNLPARDAHGIPTPMPSIEKIIQHAEENNPSKQAFTALQAAEKAIDIALFAYKHQPSTPAELSTLQAFKQDITSTLHKPQFDPYQSFGSKIPQYTANFLDNTGLGNVTAKQAYDTISTISNTIQPIAKIATDQFENITIGDVINRLNTQKTPSAREVKQQLEQRSAVGPLSEQQQANLALLNEHISQAQNKAMSTMSQYTQPRQSNAMLKAMNREPIIDQTTHMITNMPTVEEMITKAQNNPTQDTYNGLQTMLAVVKVSLRPELTPADPWYKQGWTEYKELKEYEQLLTETLQDARFTRFKPLTSQAASYIADYIPSATTILTTTGLDNMTIGQAVSGVRDAMTTTGNYVAPVIQTIETLTGTHINPVTTLQNTTLRQATDRAGITPQE